jgi:hypothetical protein
MKMEQSVPKRRHIKFRCRGITQKKEYDNACMFLDVLMNGAGWTYNIAVCKVFRVLELYKFLTVVSCGCCHLGLLPLSQHTTQHTFPETTYFDLQVNSPEGGRRWFPRRSLGLCAVTMEELAVRVIGRTSVCVRVCTECRTPCSHDMPFSS